MNNPKNQKLLSTQGAGFDLLEKLGRRNTDGSSGLHQIAIACSKKIIAHMQRRGWRGGASRHADACSAGAQLHARLIGPTRDRALINDLAGDCALSLAKLINDGAAIDAGDGRLTMAAWITCRRAVGATIYAGTGRRGREIVDSTIIEARAEVARGWSSDRPDAAAIKNDERAKKIIADAKKMRQNLRDYWHGSTLRGADRRAEYLKRDLVTVRHALILAIDASRANGHGKKSAGTNRVELHRLKKRANI